MGTAGTTLSKLLSKLLSKVRRGGGYLVAGDHRYLSYFLSYFLSQLQELALITAVNTWAVSVLL